MIEQNRATFAKCSCLTSSVITDFSNGETMCGSCGIVFDQRSIDFDHEGTRLVHPNDYLSKSRIGAFSKNTIADNLSCKISNYGTDSSGKTIPLATRHEFNRLRKWDNRTKSKPKSANLARALACLDALKNKLGLSDFVSENAAHLYRKASEKNLIRGNSVESMVAATAYAACRETGTPRSLDDVAKNANVAKKTLSRCYRILIFGLNMKPESTTSIDYISKVASSVNATEKAKRVAYNILEDLRSTKKHVGKNPIGLASAALYLSSLGTGNNITMQGFSGKNNISTVTIRKMRKLLLPFAARYIKSIDVQAL